MGFPPEARRPHIGDPNLDRAKAAWAVLSSDALNKPWLADARQRSALLVLRPERLRPAGSLLLPAAGHCERVRLHILGDDGARPDIGAVADGHRGDEGGVGADEGAGADVGPELREAVVVAGDRARAD